MATQEISLRPVTIINVLGDLSKLEAGKTQDVKKLLSTEKALYADAKRSIRKLGQESSQKDIKALFETTTGYIQAYRASAETLKPQLNKLQSQDSDNSNVVIRTVWTKFLGQQCPLLPGEETKDILLRQRTMTRHAEKLQKLLAYAERKSQGVAVHHETIAKARFELSGKKDAVSALSLDVLRANTAVFFDRVSFFVEGERHQTLESLMAALAKFVGQEGVNTESRVALFSCKGGALELTGDIRELELLKFATKEAYSMLSAGLANHSAKFTNLVPIGSGKFSEVVYSKEQGSSFAVQAKARFEIAREAGENPFASLTAVMQTVYVEGVPTTTFIFKDIQANMNATRTDLLNLERAFTGSKKSHAVSGVAKA